MSTISLINHNIYIRKNNSFSCFNLLRLYDTNFVCHFMFTLLSDVF